MFGWFYSEAALAWAGFVWLWLTVWIMAYFLVYSGLCSSD